MKRSRTTAIIVLLLSSAVGFAQSHAQGALQTQNSSAQQLLTDSIEKLDVVGVRTALDEGADPNWRDPELVLGTGPASMLTKLIEFDEPQVDEAQDQKAEEKGVVILEMLFKAGAKLQPWDRDILLTPVLSDWALLTKVLLQNGANPAEEVGALGETPMEIAVQHGDASMVELLKKYGVPVLEPRDAAQQALIGAATDHDIPRMEEAIRNGAEVNGRNRQGETALLRAVTHHSSRRTYLAITYLLKKGADPTVEGENGLISGKTTALHSAMYFSSFELNVKHQGTKTSSDGNLQYFRMSIQSLLQRGALVSARDWYGRTPLHIAAERNNVVGAQMLIETLVSRYRRPTVKAKPPSTMRNPPK